jgi:drug/metabolite transporter (DMT)-like permease
MSVGYLLNQKISLVGKNQKMLIIRGLVGSISMFSFFYILTNIPFGSAVAFKYLSPIFTALFAIFILKDKVSFIQWVFFLVTFSGIVLLKGFDTRVSTFDMIIGLLAGISGGLLVIVIRKIGEDDHHLVILHYFMFISAFFGGILSFQHWHTPNLNETFWLVIIGFIGFAAQNFFTKAIQEPTDDVSFLAFLRYSEVVYAIVVGYFYFGELYSFQSILGIVLIFSGLVLTYFFNQKKPLTINK